jgi:glucose-6-phosphate isomerase
MTIDFATLTAPTLTAYDPFTGFIDGAPVSERCLSDLRDYFADKAAVEAILATEDPVLYRVYSVEPARGEGDLMYGVGVVMPGQVGAEYYMTKGHYHAWRPAAEFYYGLSGEGFMLLEDEATGASQAVPLRPNSAVYVPGSTAHRTINTGKAPLVYIGVNPARAGHDYASIAERNFLKVLVERDGAPALLDRAEYLAILHHGAPR